MTVKRQQDRQTDRQWVCVFTRIMSFIARVFIKFKQGQVSLQGGGGQVLAGPHKLLKGHRMHASNDHRTVCVINLLYGGAR